MPHPRDRRLGHADVAEEFALASILADGTPIRLTGEDVERGTFSQRHAVLIDARTGARHIPLRTVAPSHAPFEIYNSPLSEAAAVGFEYGYAAVLSKGLLLDFFELLEPLGYVLGELHRDGVEPLRYRLERENFFGPNLVAVEPALLDRVRRRRRG